MKIDTALYNNEKRHLYFIVDTILSRDLASAFRGLCVSYAPAYTVPPTWYDRRGGVNQSRGDVLVSILSSYIRP